jgi:7,8-dihydropterin-6-yl-methyl-4-(beta-D-ribofuranosyl)aminobenzene 5'-phosphate synthase
MGVHIMTRRISSWIMLFLLVLFLPANLARAEEKTQQNTAQGKLTYIYGDRDVLKPDLQRAWGLVTLIEFDGKRILFDTGGDPKILQNNMRLLGIDPKTLDLIVVSHHHWEMIGGTEHLLQLNPKLPIISTAVVIDLLREYDRGWDLQTLSGTKQITPNIILMNLRSKPRHGGPFGIDEVHIVLKTKQGLVILQGCGHPEIVNIMQKSQAQTKEQKVYLISGGTRLLEPGTVVKLPGGGLFGIPQPHPYSDEDINKIADQLLAAEVQHIAPTHCTGERSEKIFAHKFGDRYINEKLGMVITLPPPLSSP